MNASKKFSVFVLDIKLSKNSSESELSYHQPFQKNSG